MTRSVLIAFLLALSACASQVPASSPTSSSASGPTTAAPTATPLSGLAQITHNDLQTAMKIASSVTPPDLVAVQCYKFLDDQLTSLQGTANGFITPQGLVSVFETGRIGAERVQSGLLSPAQRQAVDMACGPLALSIQGDLTGLLGALGVQGAIAFPKL